MAVGERALDGELERGERRLHLVEVAAVRENALRGGRSVAQLQIGFAIDVGGLRSRGK